MLPVVVIIGNTTTLGAVSVFGAANAASVSGDDAVVGKRICAYNGAWFCSEDQ